MVDAPALPFRGGDHDGDVRLAEFVDESASLLRRSVRAHVEMRGPLPSAQWGPRRA